MEGTEMGILKQWVTDQESNRNAIQIGGVDSLPTITVSYLENREKVKENVTQEEKPTTSGFYSSCHGQSPQHGVHKAPGQGTGDIGHP